MIDPSFAAYKSGVLNYRRLYVPGATYFFTVILRDRRRRLLTEEITAFRASWADVVKNHPFETVAAVVLPEHTHFILRLPNEDDDFTNRIRLLKSGFTRRLKRRKAARESESSGSAVSGST